MALVSIEGDHRAAAPEIFDLLDYKIVGTPALVQHAKELDAHLNGDSGATKKIVYTDGEWTHIADFELILFSEPLLWKELSKRWNTRIVAWICEGTSGTYGFSLYENGELLRQILSVDGKLSQIVGEPLPEEDGLEWEHACEDDIFVLIEHFGVHYTYMEEDREYCVYQLADL